MKKFLNLLAVAFILALGVLASCQDEFSESRQSASLLSKDSLVSQRILTLTAHDTRNDNTIDSTDCFSIKFPYQVIVTQNPDGQSTTLTIDSAEDYSAVAVLLQNTPTGSASIDFVFPITVILANYDEIIINDEEEYFGATGDCIGTENVGCLTLDYPIAVTAYDTNSQNPSVQTIDNDEEFYLMIYNLGASGFYQIQYPVSGTGADGQQVTVNSNDEFAFAIASAIDDCACNNPQILTDDLIFYMPIANNVTDLTGFSNPVINGESLFSTDRADADFGALVFGSGGEGNRVLINGNPQNDMLQNNAFTVSMWFKRQTDNFQGPAEVLFETNLMTIELLGPTSEIRSPRVVVGGTTLVDEGWIQEDLFGSIGVWHHIAVVYDGEVLTLYRDGAFQAEAAITLDGAMSPNFVGGSFPQGAVDEVRVYKRALNQGEIGTLIEIPNDNNTCL